MKYKLLNDLGIKSYLDKIFACEEAIKKTNQSDPPITDCITTSSLPAFINFLSKCRDSDSLTDEECKIIGNKLKAIIETLNNKNSSKWSS